MSKRPIPPPGTNGGGKKYKQLPLNFPKAASPSPTTPAAASSSSSSSSSSSDGSMAAMAMTHCPDSKCVKPDCPLKHKCSDGRRCGRSWQPASGFGTWTKGTKRTMACNACKVVKNTIPNAAVSEAKKKKAIAYEQSTLGVMVDLSDAAQQQASQECIGVIQKRLDHYKLLHPGGLMLMIYGTSTGSYTVEHEGMMQLTARGYQTPPIVGADGQVIPSGLQGSYGPGGESVYDCGPSKVLSKVVEKAAQTHFTPICDAPDSMMPRTWKRIGAGGPKGIGPYHVCIRVMPLPLPHGWHRSF